MSVTKKKIPPDGGYGWIIMCAYALHHFVSIPIMQGFGLLYRDTFKDLGFSATDTSLIINTNAAFSMFSGIINGPLLKHLGYRKVSICGACLTTVGVLLTARATTFLHFMVTYGFITSLGMGMGMSSYPVALNTYFTKRRSKAAGYTMTIAGLGPVVMPQLISLLLANYGVKWAMSILGAIAAHTFVSSLLLQPVKWHMKEEIVDEEEGKKDDENEKEEEKEDNTLLRNEKQQNNLKKAESVNSLSYDVEVEAIYGIDTPLAGSMMSLAEEGRERLTSNSIKRRRRRNDEENLKEKEALAVVTPKEEKVYNPDLSVAKEKPSLLQRIWRNIVETFDLNLLKDPTYVNIMLGMSLAVFAEMNFSLMTPFIMEDFDFSTQQTATFMSVISICDICFRFLAPFIGDLLKQPHRIMYLFSLWFLIFTRFSLLTTYNYVLLMVIAAGLGIAKGVRTVYWSLVLPSHVPIERLGAALGIQMTVNGATIWMGGPVIGLVRDVTGSYRNCIYVINAVTFMTIMMWTVELTYKRYKANKKNADDVEKK